ncbi:MAG: hypothetical protein IJ944_01660 [Clostridia bacterium]|nr:hypothetical protein [Clostridia bacterium]
MKKYAKIIALILSVVTLCTILCSCDALDDMKAKQGFWQEDGTILYNGNTYLKLPEYAELNYDSENVANIDYIHVTEKDVPVILSQQFGSYRNVTKDNVIIYGNGEMHALAGKYAQIEKEMQKAIRGEYEVFTAIYYNDDGTNTKYNCTADEISVIKDITSQNSLDISYSWDDITEIPITCSTENGYFGYYFGSIIRFDSDKYVVTKNMEYEGTINFLVPEKYQKDMEDIFSRCKYS